MSFILDALKKSEMERQRQTLPGLIDPGTMPPRRRFPVWAAALGGLLGINLLVLCVVLLRRDPAPLAAPGNLAAAASARVPPTGPGAPAGAGAQAGPAMIAGQAAPTVAAPAAAPIAAATPLSTPSTGSQPPSAPPAGADHFSPMDAAPSYAPEIPLEAAAATTGPADADNNATARHADAPVRKAASRSAPEPEEPLPSLREMNGGGAEALPEMHLDIDVYAANPADRFAYINSRKYREGDQLKEGPTIEKIRRDGVVLNYQGMRFLLPPEQ